jgi:hypothetical protein
VKLVARPQEYARRVLLAIWGIVLATLLAIAIASVIGPPGGDSSIYMYVGKGILEGEIPYLDRWDNKGPLLYALNALAILINPAWGLWLIQTLFLLGSVALAFLALKRLFSTLPALFALALYLVFFAKFAPPGNFTEQYGLFFQFATLYLFLRSQEQVDAPANNPRFALLHLSIGFLGAASFLLRPNLVALWIIIGLYWLFLRGVSLRKLAWAVVGGGSILIAVAGLFAALGAFGALWEAVFGFSFAQSSASYQDRLGVAWGFLEQTLPISILVIAALAIGGFLLAQSRTLARQFRSAIVVALLLLPLEVASLSLSGFSGPGFYHYYLAALPVTALLLAMLAWATLKFIPIAPTLTALLMLIGVAYFSLHTYEFAQIKSKYTRGNIVVDDIETRLGRRVRELTAPNDRILVWGKRARIHLISERDAPSRFFYHHPLVKPNFADDSIRDEFFADVKKGLPALIIDSRFPYSAPLNKEERASWEPHRRFLHDPKDFKQFFDFVEENYVVVDVFAPYVVYGLRGEDDFEPGAIQGELIIRSTYEVYLHDRTLTFVKTPCTQEDAAKRFIVHIFPVDRSVIGGNEHANRDFNFVEGKEWKVGDGCIVSQELPNYPIAAIRVGQYNTSRSGHDWLREYRFPAAE